ncbi:2-desacetyl-2-hydroxyethyl bacteriochlorophyllide A dehydrogenase [Devosia lucknowensis]|uniref:2-desacetyl-2-hydroxyethyl bacteriochlorophyllide A dehydrogenase n=1 Tax=Devosia lucknowensis TaxID=1096929 RepID=A0A1Y6G7E9_9HYPH|nr:zinc-binding alcohol dehydrogenase family protein [Devosia lucknowensis]SMQ85263.1 2-desacetyl-2-hydroxyethyl bacteriochlorophyllide A dehydrogenase [Devosia lucknowensis]
MRAIRCDAPGELALVEIDRPELKDGWVRVAISHIGICGTDYHIYEGKHPFLQYPRIMGHELSGRILDANGATGLTDGDAVVINPYLPCHHCPACREGKTNCCETLTVLGVHGDGGMAEEIVLPAENLYPADGLSLRDAAMVEFLAIGAHAVRRTELRPGWRVLVVGGGPIGLGVAFFARIAGASVTILDAAADKLDAARQFDFGAAALDEREGPAFQAVMGSGFDAVFDATGSIAAMNAAVAYCRNGGALTLVGVVKGTLNWEDPEIHRRELTIRASRNATREDFDHVMASIRSGAVPTDRLATHATSFEDAVTNLPVWAKARQGLIKAIISV